ncbi:MAG TPA: glycosyltransferase family 4 protein [Mycobacterium sp.]|uniref:glycosyltransferase family 4 protein n=1 Tax=Mycolicibacterium sp. TaxID=2320850 RepID=UPI0025F5738A|nr:glycosyltransferase family 4 protein [Mycolicibacterium sp.]HPX36636.1 glycosyltransferase family 4 protein [Mycobacterium sp.]HQC76751.1 glycosyltransferase family 4 protein [Mycobacterium sp.]
MRILLLAQFIPPLAGGEERHVWNLARGLSARGHDVTLLGFANDGDSPAGVTESDGVRLVRVRTTASRLPVLYSDKSRPHALPLPDPAVSRAIRQELAVGRFDVVHAHNWIVNSALGPASRAGVPLVMTLHDYSHVCATKRLMEFERRRCPGPSPKRCLPCASAHYGAANGPVTLAANVWSARRRARHITAAAAVSSAVAEAVAVPAGRWLHSAALHARVIPNFIPDEIIVDDIAPTQPDAPLLFAGDLSFDKGVPVLLDAYAQLESPPPLVLAGRMGTGDSWNFPTGAQWLGEVPHHEVVALFNSARAVIVPSVWADPCPTVVLEAMAAGRPVLAAASGGILDMVVDGVTGLLVPAGDAGALAAALNRLLQQPETALAFGVAGRDRAREFTVSSVVSRIEAMYADAIRAVR